MKIFFAVSAIGEIVILVHNAPPQIPTWLLVLEALIVATINLFGYKWTTKGEN